MINEEFNKEAVGSAYHLGDPNSSRKIVFMHGNGMHAPSIQNSAEYLEQNMDDVHIIVPNGSYRVPDSFITEEHRQGIYRNHTPYTWYNFDEENTGRLHDPLKDRLADLKADPDNRIYMVGFSIGGLRASDEFIKAAGQGICGAVLHSSAMAHLPKHIPEKVKDHSAPADFYTVVGLKDPFLRMKQSPKIAWAHYKNQKKMRREGYNAETKFYWDLDHNMYDHTLADVITHLEKRDQYILAHK